MGAHKNPYYRIVVADSRYPRDGRFIEEIGTYDPMTKPSTVVIDADKASEWLKKGAQPTDTVKAILKKNSLIGKDFRRNGRTYSLHREKYRVKAR